MRKNGTGICESIPVTALQQVQPDFAASVSSEWKKGDEPYYPVNDEKNNGLYRQYQEKAREEKKVIFGGRLGSYQYYDMDKVIAAALDLCGREL